MKSWKTTLAGVVTIIAALGNAYLEWNKTGNIPSLEALLTQITIGIGLITAKDFNVTGGTVQNDSASK